MTIIIIIISIISCNMQGFILFLFIAGSTGKGSQAPGWKGGLCTTGGAARLEVKKIAVIAAAAVVGVITVRKLPTAEPWTVTLMKISLQISSKVSYFIPAFLPFHDNVQIAMLYRHASPAFESTNE